MALGLLGAGAKLIQRDSALLDFLEPNPASKESAASSSHNYNLTVNCNESELDISTRAFAEVMAKAEDAAWMELEQC